MSKQIDPNQQIIEEKLSQAMKLIRECEAIANEHKLMFSMQVAYGMGGDYYGDQEQWDDEYMVEGWAPSSMGC